MAREIECFFQEQMRVSQGDSAYLSRKLDNLDGTYRLLIQAPQVYFAPLLGQLHLSTKWIIFSSTYNTGFVQCPLPWLARWRMIVMSDGKELYYQVTDALADVREVIESNLWSSGAGLVLPVQQVTGAALARATDIQLNVAARQLELLTEPPYCFGMAHRNGTGINFIWSSRWTFSAPMLEWAQALVKKYPWVIIDAKRGAVPLEPAS